MVVRGLPPPVRPPAARGGGGRRQPGRRGEKHTADRLFALPIDFVPAVQRRGGRRNMKVLIDFVSSVVALTSSSFSSNPVMLRVEATGAAEVAEAVTQAGGGGAVRSLYYMTDGGEWCALCAGVAMEDVTWSDEQALKVRAVSDASWGQGASAPAQASPGDHRGGMAGMAGMAGMHGMQMLTGMRTRMHTCILAPLRSTWDALPSIRWWGAAAPAEAEAVATASRPARRQAVDDGKSLIVDSNVQWSLTNAGLSRRPGHS